MSVGEKIEKNLRDPTCLPQKVFVCLLRVSSQGAKINFGVNHKTKQKKKLPSKKIKQVAWEV